ncbi:MAG TPA: sensor histidine kinase [Acidobacteriaceae bacterium]|nr:sensor histidine kinase [Acidobacteriaceae bacterium]
MRSRIWPAVAVSFGALLLLLPLFTWLVSHQAARIQQQTKTARQIYQKADDAISDIQASINTGALIEQGGSTDGEVASAESRISELRKTTVRDIGALAILLGSKQKPQLKALEQGLEEYWSSIEQNLAAARTRHGQQRFFSELESRPKKVLELAGRIDDLNQASLARREQETEHQQNRLRRVAVAATLILLFLELAIALFSTAYMARLDRISGAERQRAEKAESELRRLSNQLVRVQEEERKTISRELHDEVGQILTGLRMELGTLSAHEPEEAFRQRLDSVKHLAEEALRAVRNLSLLVRPSMLDDLGLEPALRWQTREFSRRCGIPVNLAIEGRLDNLPEPLRLCLYRAIQEALTNCGKHANATRVTVTVRHDDGRVSASVQDNGKGFDKLRLQTHGLGLVGMGERVRALQGVITVSSEPGRGTLISLEVPLAASRLDRTG